MNVETKEFAERRSMHRHPVDMHGKIKRGGKHPESICSIRNMSLMGAELRVGGDQQFPDEFLLVVRAEGRTYRCRQHWRERRRMGVEFVGVETDPVAHC